MGGVYNVVNFHLYHYAGNNPVKYTDPDGRATYELTDEQWKIVKQDIDSVVQNLDSLINELKKFKTGTGDLSQATLDAAQSYLGVDFTLPADSTAIAYNLEKIKGGLESMTKNDFRYDDFNNNPKKSGTFGWTFFFGKKIYLGKNYFDSSNRGNDTRQGVLVHEKSHQWSAIGAINVPPNPYGVYNARNRTFLKSNNADNWEYFYERVFTGGR